MKLIDQFINFLYSPFLVLIIYCLYWYGWSKNPSELAIVLMMFYLWGKGLGIWRARKMESETLSGSEAITGFCSWLGQRKKKASFGSGKRPSDNADLIRQFCQENEMAPQRKGFEKNIKFPSS